MTIGADLTSIVFPILTHDTWGCSVGHGSFLMLNFGPVLDEIDTPGPPRGLWHLWVYFGEWAIKIGGTILATANDDRTVMHNAVERLNGRALESFDQEGSVSRLIFSGAAELNITSSFDEMEPDWMLFFPEHMVLTCGQGGALSVSKSTEA